MKTFFSMSSRTGRIASIIPANRSLRLVRTFVETGDERCPMAGVWLPIADGDAAVDEPERKRPAIGILLPWRAFTLRSQSSDTLFFTTCWL